MADVDTQQLDMLLNTVRTLEPLIREHADEAERNRRLSQPVVAALAEAGFFRLYTPRTLGGFELDPLTFYRVVEDLARIDGSTAWCVWIGTTIPIFAPNLTDQAAEEIFGRDPPRGGDRRSLLPSWESPDPEWWLCGEWALGVCQRLPPQRLDIHHVQCLRRRSDAPDREGGSPRCKTSPCLPRR